MSTDTSFAVLAVAVALALAAIAWLRLFGVIAPVTVLVVPW